jgi:flagellar FliJ protein
MGFQFSLATVLRIRVILEEQEERMLQKILTEIVRSKEAIARIDDAIARSNDSRSEDLFKPFFGYDLQAFYGEVKELKQNRKDIEEQISRLEQLRDKQLEIYKKARQNREMLTDMREDKRSAYESDVARLDQKVLDDLFISRRGRN